MEGGSRVKQAEYQRKYVKNNPLMAKLSQKKKELAILKKRKDDPEFDAVVRRKEADKKTKAEVKEEVWNEGK